MNQSALSCWEFWNCDKKTRENCYVFKKGLGGYCWVITHLMPNRDEKCPKVKEGIESCFDCPWYKIVAKRSLLDAEGLEWDGKNGV